MTSGDSDCFRDYSIVCLVVVLACSTCHGCITPSELLNAKRNSISREERYGATPEVLHISQIVDIFPMMAFKLFARDITRVLKKTWRANIWEEFQS